MGFAIFILGLVILAFDMLLVTAVFLVIKIGKRQELKRSMKEAYLREKENKNNGQIEKNEYNKKSTNNKPLRGGVPERNNATANNKGSGRL